MATKLEKEAMKMLQKEMLKDLNFDEILKSYTDIGTMDPGSDTEMYEDEKKKGGKIKKKKKKQKSKTKKIMQGYKAGGKV